MIKATGKMGGQPLLILGLSTENTTRLRAGKPILVDTAALGLPAMRVLLVGGDTEEEITAELQQHFDMPETTT
jgi:hypothetical protein